MSILPYNRGTYSSIYIEWSTIHGPNTAPQSPHFSSRAQGCLFFLKTGVPILPYNRVSILPCIVWPTLHGPKTAPQSPHFSSRGVYLSLQQGCLFFHVLCGPYVPKNALVYSSTCCGSPKTAPQSPYFSSRGGYFSLFQFYILCDSLFTAQKMLLKISISASRDPEVQEWRPTDRATSFQWPQFSET